MRSDLNTPDRWCRNHNDTRRPALVHNFRYGIAVDLEDLGEAKSPFYDIYDLKIEEIPSEDEWALRMKEMARGRNEPQCMPPSEEESEEEDWPEEVSVKVTTSIAAVSDVGGVEKNEGKNVEKFVTIKEDL